MEQQRLAQAAQARKAEESKRDEREAGQLAADDLGPSAQRLGFSDPRHARHALYQDLCGRLQDKGQLAGLSDARLNQFTGELHQAGFETGGKWAATVMDGKTFHAQHLDITGAGDRVTVDLSHPAPTVQQTLAQVADFDRQQTMQAQQRLEQQQAPQQARAM